MRFSKVVNVDDTPEITSDQLLIAKRDAQNYRSRFDIFLVPLDSKC